MKESTKGNSLVGSASGASNATIRIRAMKEGATNAMGSSPAGNEEDDDSDIASQDVSLDLDDDDEEEGNAVKRSASMVIGSSAAMTAATLTPAPPKLHLLKSVYAGRPMTVFFPYHKSC